MNLTKLSLSAAIAGVIAVGAITPSAAAPSSYYPLVALNISGTLYSTTNSGQAQKIPLKTVSYTTASLIKLLNASTNATNFVQTATGTNQIPAGSYFLWDPYEDELFLTNKNGFFFPLKGSGYDLGYLEVDEYHLIGTYKYQSLFTLAGTETDKTGIYFYFSDGQSGFKDNVISTSGTATLNWTYGAASGGTQKATLSVTMAGNSDDGSYVGGFEAVSTSFSASGSGSKANESTDYEPFFYEY